MISVRLVLDLLIKFAKLLGVPNGISMKYTTKVLLFFYTCNILYEKSAKLSFFALFLSIFSTFPALCLFAAGEVGGTNFLQKVFINIAGTLAV